EPRMPAKILAFSGSLRADSFNQRIVALAADMARERGAETTVLSLRDYPMPIFNQDDEDASGVPAEARAFREQLMHHDGFVIGCPEYNSSITAALKNAIDWATRAKAEGEGPLDCFTGKVVALTAASPGGFGGLRGLDHVREILSNVGCHIVPGMVAIPAVHNAFDAGGNLTNDRARGSLESLVDNVVRTASATAQK
ncbi:MAG: NAD(P)H-dependent oxidoreductase, partial [Planctomycetota bacterium]